MSVIARRLFVSGRVQGVGFRWALCAEARRLDLAGWVRNLRDGRVEALVCGEEEAVDHLTLWAQNGPSTARVDNLLANPEPVTDNTRTLKPFALRATA